MRSPDAKPKSTAVGLLEPSEQRTKPLSGNDISGALEAKGWSKAKLAKSLGVDRSLVTRWIKGERTIQPRHQIQIKALLLIA
ncbi:helix-turn-helix domain-containing protein [Vacuolonema iberomarrocanum]|uniref:helix-turn-helix domain-containing protein n=1 Tax=Vacuolonema iberomarrocanum TaxID=3454632 RepID=UPI0019F96573|nr:helix-turn-helix transcriptional regulator [filamentous cyanobacterium LEGE 07170]